MYLVWVHPWNKFWKFHILILKRRCDNFNRPPHAPHIPPPASWCFTTLNRLCMLTSAPWTEDAQTFTEEECENESKGHWYYRQLLGSSNFEGGRWLHVLSGHLSYQIEHHLFPDIPAHRYAEMSPKVKAVCEKYGLNYNTGSFAKQYGTVLKRLWTYSKPPKQAALLA